MGVSHAVAVVVTLLVVCEVRAIPKGHHQTDESNESNILLKVSSSKIHFWVFMIFFTLSLPIVIRV